MNDLNLQLQVVEPDGEASTYSATEIAAAVADLHREARTLARALGVNVTGVENTQRGAELILLAETDLFTEAGEPYTFCFRKPIRTLH